MTIKDCYIVIGNHEITLNRLIKGWQVDSTSQESTIIRAYNDFLIANLVGKGEMNADSIMSNYFKPCDAVFWAVRIIHFALNSRRIGRKYNLLQIIDFATLAEADDDTAYEIIHYLCLKIL